MADFKDFILDFYKKYNATQMDAGRAERWRDLRGKPATGEWNPVKQEFNWLEDKRSPAMKGWEKKGNGKAAPGDADYYATAEQALQHGIGDLFTADDLPDPNIDLSDDDWKKFYTTIRSALRNIDANKADLKRADPDNPLAHERFFGDKNVKPFSPFEPDEAIVKQPLKKLGELLSDPALADFANWLEAPQAYGNRLFTEKPTLGEFIIALKDGKYDINKGIPQKIKDLLSQILGWMNPQFGASPIAIFPTAIKELAALFGPKGQNISKIQIALDSNNEEIDKDQLNEFKNPRFYKEFLRALYANDKPEKKSPFNTQFANAGGGEITGWMAESVTGANDWESALVPKLEDEKNIRETWGEKIGDWRDEHLKRLYDRSARHVYIESNAAPVVAAILKEKVSPTDGILKMIEKKDAIAKRVKAKQPSAAKGVDFMFEALEYIKNSGDMDKALEGAFRNGAKAQAIATTIIEYAMAKGKVNEAKVALETLAVMRYDTLSSAHWAELKKNPLKPFEGASFMKTEPIKFIMNAATKALNVGIGGAYWAGVIGRNMIQYGRAEIPKSKIRSLDFGRIEVAIKKINRDTEDFTSLEDAEAELQGAEENLSNFNAKHSDVLRLQSRNETLLKRDEVLRRQLDANLKYQRAKEITDWWNSNHQTIEEPHPTFSEIDISTATPSEIYNELGFEKLQEYFNTLIAGMNDVKPSDRFDKAKVEQLIQTNKSELDDVKTKLDNNKDIFAQHDALIGATRAIRSEKLRLEDNKKRALKGETEHKPYGAPKTPAENFQMLMAFWNAANGYTELSVNNYNIFRNIKDVRKTSNLRNDFETYFANNYSRAA